MGDIVLDSGSRNMAMSLRRVINTGAIALSLIFTVAATFSWRMTQESLMHAEVLEEAVRTKSTVAAARQDLALSGLLSKEPAHTDAEENSRRAALLRLRNLATQLHEHAGDSSKQEAALLRLADVLSKGGPELGEQADHLLTEIRLLSHRTIDTSVERSQQASRWAVRAGLGAAALGLAFVVWLSMSFNRRQRRDAEYLLAGFEGLGRLDFDYRIPDSDRDTFSLLGRSFNTAAQHLKQASSEMRAQHAAIIASTDKIVDKMIDASVRTVLIVRNDGSIARANSTATVMLQRSREELLQLNIADVLPPNMIARSRPAMTDHRLVSTTAHQPLFEDSCKYVRPDGTEFDVDLEVLLMNHEGEMMTFIVMTDVTQRVKQFRQLQAEARAARSAIHRHEMITEAAELGCWLYDYPDGTVHVDDRYLSILGYTRENFNPVADTFFNSLHPEDQARAKEIWREQLAGHLKRAEGQFRLRHQKGHWIWIFTVSSVIFDAAGQIVAIAGTHRDITQEVTTRDELESQRRLLSSLSGNIPGVLHRLTAHPDGRRSFRYIGENSEAVLGVPAVQFDLDTLAERMDSEHSKEFIDGLEYSIKEGFDIHREFRIRRRDGQQRWIRMLSHVVASTSGGGTWDGIFTDVTDEVVQRDAIEAARKEADKANHAKSRFLASMSHELRTPLSGMLAATNILEETTLTTSQRELLGMQREAGETLMAVLTDVLDLSKIESGKFDLNPEVIDIEKLVARTMDVVRTQATSKGLSLQMTIQSSVTRYAIGDGVRLRQVLLNLMNNAVKFTDAGSVDVYVDEIPAYRAQHLMRFTVADTGVGIDTGSAPNVFDAFQQAGTSVSRSNGTGLGLTICRRLVDLMGGRIGYDSVPGKGSRFWFEVPLHRVQAMGSQKGVNVNKETATEPAAAQEKNKPLRLLVAEDIQINQRVAEIVLTRAGHAVTIVSNGEEALEALGCEDFDAVIMDARMPVLDGLEATRRIRASAGQAARIPILGLTADVVPERLQECTDAGMDVVLTKPFNRENLLHRLETLTSGRPNESQRSQQRS